MRLRTKDLRIVDLRHVAPQKQYKHLNQLRRRYPKLTSCYSITEMGHGAQTKTLIRQRMARIKKALRKLGVKPVAVVIHSVGMTAYSRG